MSDNRSGKKNLAYSLQELARLIDRNEQTWKIGREHFYNGLIPAWLRVTGRGEVAQAWEELSSNINDHDQALELILEKMDPQLPRPQLMVEPQQISLTMTRGQTQLQKFNIRNLRQRGCLTGTIHKGDDSDFVKVLPKSYKLMGGQSAKINVDINVPVDSYTPLRTNLLVFENGQSREINVPVEIRLKKTTGEKINTVIKGFFLAGIISVIAFFITLLAFAQEEPKVEWRIETHGVTPSQEKTLLTKASLNWSSSTSSFYSTDNQFGTVLDREISYRKPILFWRYSSYLDNRYQYLRFSFSGKVNEKNRDYITKRWVRLKIYGDNRLLYSSPKMNSKSDPIDTGVDLRGVELLKIEFETTGLDGTITDPILIAAQNPLPKSIDLTELPFTDIYPLTSGEKTLQKIKTKYVPNFMINWLAEEEKNYVMRDMKAYPDYFEDYTAARFKFDSYPDYMPVGGVNHGCGISCIKNTSSISEASIVYNLDGKYIALNGLFGEEKGTNPDDWSQLKIFGDQKLIYQSPRVNMKSPPVIVSVGIREVKTLRVVFVINSVWNKPVFANPRLTYKSDFVD